MARAPIPIPMSPVPEDAVPARRLFGIFLRLGLTAFGGPVAHLAYFHAEFVLRRRWLQEADYAELVALCQLLPGPASSQVGMAIGLRHAGLPGALAAWAGFTLPSAVLMIGLALGLAHLGGGVPAGLLHGLKLVAVVVVAHAVWSMARLFCRAAGSAALALLAAAALVAWPLPAVQIAVIAAGAVVGMAWMRPSVPGDVPALPVRVSPVLARGARWAFVVLLAGLPLWALLAPGSMGEMLAAFYRAGALVFGGGHVVLPLLETAVVGRGWMDADTFMSGYGAAQALPGPLFAFAGFLGAGMQAGPGGWAGGMLALVAVFLPSLLLVLGVMPIWEQARRDRRVRAAITGVNAVVVGVLLAALVDPLWRSAVGDWRDAALVAAGVVALAGLRLPVWLLVPLMALAGWPLSAG